MGKQLSPATAARKAQSWHDQIARQANSGKTIAAFCRDEGLSEGNFYFWRNRLRIGGKEISSQPSTNTAFIDLGVVETVIKDDQPRPAAPNQKSVPSGIEMRIDLGGGIVLTITRH